MILALLDEKESPYNRLGYRGLSIAGEEIRTDDVQLGRLDTEPSNTLSEQGDTIAPSPVVPGEHKNAPQSTNSDVDRLADKGRAHPMRGRAQTILLGDAVVCC